MNPHSTFEPASTNSNPAPEFSPEQFTKSGGKAKKFFVGLLVLLLIAGGVYGGYAYGNGQNKNAAKTSVQPAAAPAVNQNSASVHFVASEGYPFDLGAKKIFTTKLGIPATFQATRVPSNNGNHGPEQYFTDKYNDELARFIIGNPADPGDNGGGYSETSVLAISKSWLAANAPKDVAGNTEFATGYKLETPADKQKFLATLKTDTEACVKDAKKGFTTKDGLFKICYELNFGKESYNPSISLKGYAEKEATPVFLTGLINIADDTPMANQEAEQKAVADAKSGNYTAKFTASLSTLLAALKQTTLTTADNPQKTN
jgi:hypothetical protein